MYPQPIIWIVLVRPIFPKILAVMLTALFIYLQINAIWGYQICFGLQTNYQPLSVLRLYGLATTTTFSDAVIGGTSSSR